MGEGGGGVGTGIQDPKFMEGIMSGSLRSHEIIYQKRSFLRYTYVLAQI